MKIKLNQTWKYKSGERTCIVEHIAHEVLPAIYYKLENSEDIDVCSEKQFLHQFHLFRENINAGDWYTEQGIVKQAEEDACVNRMKLINRLGSLWVPTQNEWICYEGFDSDANTIYTVARMTGNLYDTKVIPLDFIDKLKEI